MRRHILSIVIALGWFHPVGAQELWDKVLEANSLIEQNDYEAADSIINTIGLQCQNSDNDTIKVFYYGHKGFFLTENKKYKESIPYLLKTIDLYEKLNIKNKNYVEAFHYLGYSYGRLGDYNNAERYYRKALLKSVVAEHSADLRQIVYRNLGNLYKEKGDTLLANECYERANTTDTNDYDFIEANNTDWESSFWNRITRNVENKQYEEAASLYVEFIKGLKERKGNKHDTYLLAVESRAILLSRYLGRIDEAIPLYEELVSLSDSVGHPSESICGAFCNLALCHAQKGQYKKTEEIIQQGYRYLARTGTAYYPKHSIYRYAGNGAYWTNDYQHAIKYYEQYLSPVYDREDGKSYEEIANMLSVAYIRSGKPEKAEKLLTELLKTDEKRLKKDNRQALANIYHNLGRAYMLRGSATNALPYLNKSKEMQLELYGEVTENTQKYINECMGK